MKKFLVLLVLMGLVLIPFAKAATPGGATATLAKNEGAYNGSSAGSYSVTSGTIYAINMTSVQDTYRWVGIYGNTTGTIVLADTSGNYFFNWTGAKGVLVYASPAGSITWGSLASASATSTGMPTWLNDTAYTDNYQNTFKGAAESIGSNIFTTLTASYAQAFPTASNWKTYSLTDGTNLVWAAKVNASGASTYNGQSAQFELILPENGTAGDTTATANYFWLELQ